MLPLRYLLAGLSACLLAGCGSPADQAASAPAPAPTSEAQTETIPSPAKTLADLGVNAGTYALDKGHASLVWTVSHNGLSRYTTRFTDFDARIELDTEAPATSRLTANINPLSVRTDHPSGSDWDMTLTSDAKWFNANVFPEITYTSTGIRDISDMSAVIDGELSLLGVTRPVALNVTMNGVRNFPWFGERDVIGFSATANLTRSDFGMLALLPDIGDEVTIQLEVEFVQAE
jgi:polyisoprenoid-binding protein YceI